MGLFRVIGGLGFLGFGFVWAGLLDLVFWCGFLVWVCFGVVCLISFSGGVRVFGFVLGSLCFWVWCFLRGFDV